MKSIVKVEIIARECAGIHCSICLSFCPSNAIFINNSACVDAKKCIGCGKCAENICPNYAISIIQEEVII